MRPIVLLLLLLFAIGCASKAVDDGVPEVREKLYIDANLAFSMMVPEDWKRSFITPPPGSPARYSVRWKGAIKDEPVRLIELQVALLPITSRLESSPAILQELALSHPALTITGQQQLADQPDAPLVFSGRTPDRQHQLMLVTARQGHFRIELSAPTEDFAAYELLFTEILASFQPFD